jgi:solute:Na+ symporter, SSS family
MKTVPMGLSIIDFIIIAVYMVGILTIGIISSHKRRTTSNEYFLAGRSLRWLMVGSALFATNISTIHLVGLAASGYSGGLVWGNFEWMASFTLIILGLVFAPFYFRSQITTLPEYLEKRYSTGSRTVLAFVAVLSALLIHIGVSLFAVAAVFETLLGVKDVVYQILGFTITLKFLIIIVVSLITVVYTVLGGLKAVVVTENIQTFVLLLGAVAVTVFALFALPHHGINSLADFKAAIKPGQISMIRPLHDAQGNLSELSWFSVLFGYPILGIWYWCTDQTIVQRVLGSKTQRDAQIGPIFAGFLKILPVFIMVLPGVLGYVLFSSQIAADNNATLPVMIMNLIPTGMKGIIAAGLLAAVMSTVAGALNSSATLVAVDIVKRVWPATKDQTQVFIGRISAVGVMILAILWSPLVGRNFDSIFVAINKIPMMFAPAITCVFLLGVFWRRGTKQAAFFTLISGFIIGSIYFIIDLPVFGTIQLISDPVNGWGIPFMQIGWWLFCINCIVFITVSLLTPSPSEDKLKNLCWDHPLQTIREGKLTGPTDPRMIAGYLLLTMVVLYIVLH